MKKLTVNLGNNSYDIQIGSGVLGQAGHELSERGFTGQAVIITNPLVNNLHGDRLRESLTQAGFTASVLLVPDGEEQKSLTVAGRLYHELAEHYVERTTPILALGGGVIGDLAGFVAATYLRGVPLIQVPTTLLAQVDSSIGGKVALDHDLLKNKIGAFYQPKLVISDISTLKTLDPKILTDGLAEVIKYGVIWDKPLLTYLEDNLNRIKAFDEGALGEIVLRSAEIKAKVVATDERDTGLRAILNYGHTVGHAIEAVSDFKIAHGEAVALGMIAAARISNRMDMLKTEELIRLQNLIGQAGLPTRLPDYRLPDLIQAMKHDKKVTAGKIRFILPKSLGKVLLTDSVSLSLVEQILSGWKETD
jgi:3-dehydroquinate synthase